MLLPLANKDGKAIKPELFELTRAELMERFGGLCTTPYPRSGYWVDQGKEYQDQLLLYVVDVDDTSENYEWFTFYKPTLLERFEQLEVYLISYPIDRI